MCEFNEAIAIKGLTHFLRMVKKYTSLMLVIVVAVVLVVVKLTAIEASGILTIPLGHKSKSW